MEDGADKMKMYINGLNEILDKNLDNIQRDHQRDQRDHIFHTKQYQAIYRKIKYNLLIFRGVQNGYHQDFQYLMVSIFFFFPEVAMLM